MDKNKRIVIGLSGASGAIYGVRLLEILTNRPDVESHLIISAAARLIIEQEIQSSTADIAALADHTYAPNELTAPIASGSFHTDGMVIAPCSIKSLSAVAHSYASNLMSRAADVTLKERRPLILVVRETPLHTGHLRLMTQASEIGSTILPPIPAFYGRPETVDDIVNETVGRILDQLDIDNDLYTRWQG